MRVQMKTLAEFLLRNSVQAGGNLPLVHSTPAYHLRSFLDCNELSVSPCDVFANEKLNYFFVGRPAYKYVSQESEAAYWEYPCCFIFDFSTVTDIRRVFPFDSGAFSRKLYPNYIQMMPMESFNVGAIADAPAKIVGAFFGSPQNYFGLNPKAEKEFVREYSLTAMDAEIKALHRLSTERSAATFDDRRLTIEVQTGQSLDLAIQRPMAVIAPSQYYDDPDFRKHVVEVWGAEPISYPVFSLSIANVYAQIYERVQQFYTRKGIL